MEIRRYSACDELPDWVKEEWIGAKTVLKAEREHKGNWSQVLASLKNVILSLFRINNVTNVAAELKRLQYYPLEYKRYLYNKL